MNILLSGGGTLGSVTPLLALVPELRRQGHDIVFVGTSTGPERALVEETGVSFFAISAPRFPRYLSMQHLFIPFQLITGLWQSFRVLRRLKPDVIVSAGSFVSVPLVWIGTLMHIRSAIHQQDLQPGWAIRLMQPFARSITVAFEDSMRYFPAKKTEWAGNPVRDLTPTTNEIACDQHVPTVMIFGGGTGARAINALVTEQLCTFANVIHLTGKGRDVTQCTHPRYHKYEFLGEEMKEALAKADVIVARAGIGTISELAVLGKPSIIIPMPGTHQEKNAEFLQRHAAAIIVDQAHLTATSFITAIQKLLSDKNKQQELSQRIHTLNKPDAIRECVRKILD